ncbi:crotonase/enoyl-CoA hydratase family protein [Henriciella mobilis]|mgnify:CR=1 FL=1|uniref:Enoyl-CoA hydratase n=1 Tax=Henriciella mobilis TaxID=2305467 RepID=A0A399RTI6_9PROT|nr:crotonase/enoyl-CoA hydratase family protein [Henriciella mobilis]RIJ13766.1 enoyl-CoA hydratase [Henriciella mobilis]RIJ21026.1 enoyl-CoA hydratase [Henriciella mobilis]RIJ32795.1 enoyl-CoA hydratase [Henriciella mobilis]
MFDEIIYEAENGRARITLNRPDKLNALTMKMQAELSEALWQADNDRDVHCVIIKGAGRGFSAGYDLSGSSAVPVSRLDSETGNKRGARSVDDDIWQLERAQRYRMAIFDLHKPVIAQVHGPCVAGGTDIALLCDIVIIADDAKVSFPAGRNLGALPNQMWLYNVGPQWTKRLMLTGDSITGTEAAQLGFAMKAVPADMLEAEVEGLADRMALIDPDILAANKRAINLGMELMGARTMQRLAVENDVRGHQAASAHAFVKRVGEAGLKQALSERDTPFGDGRARVNGPEIRDSEGKLRDD